MAAEKLLHFVDAGSMFSLGSIDAGESANYEVEFETNFPSAPVVVVSPYRTSESPAWVGEMNIGVVGKTATGFTVRVTNNSSASHALGGFYWIAVLR